MVCVGSLTHSLMSRFCFRAQRALVVTHVAFALLQTASLVLLNTTRSWSLVALNSACAVAWAGVVCGVREIEALEREAERLRRLRVERERALGEGEMWRKKVR